MYQWLIAKTICLEMWQMLLLHIFKIGMTISLQGVLYVNKKLQLRSSIYGWFL